MKRFDYEKAYCCIVLPEYEKLEDHVKKVFKETLLEVEDLSQKRDLNIPVLPETREKLNTLTREELANLSRISYFLNHWKPSLVQSPVDMKYGAGWKLSNVIDQLLRERLKLPSNVEIHQGILRVTFSSEDCWMWEEFGLATKENLEKFRSCGLGFHTEKTFKKNAQKLKSLCNDLWPSPEDVEETEAYKNLLAKKRQKELEKIHERYKDDLMKAEAAKKRAKIEYEFSKLLHSLELPIDDVIYYAHKQTFCFGWREGVTVEERDRILSALKSVENCPKVEFELKKN